MKPMTIGLRIVEIILFILLIQGALVAVVAVLGLLFAAISASLPTLEKLLATLLGLPLAIVPGSILWFWFKVPGDLSRSRIIMLLSGLAIWLALIGFGNVYTLSLADADINQAQFLKSILLNPAFLNSILCQICLLYIGFSPSAKEFYSVAVSDMAAEGSRKE